MKHENSKKWSQFFEQLETLARLGRQLRDCAKPHPEDFADALVWCRIEAVASRVHYKFVCSPTLWRRGRMSWQEHDAAMRRLETEVRAAIPGLKFHAVEARLLPGPGEAKFEDTGLFSSSVDHGDWAKVPADGRADRIRFLRELWIELERAIEHVRGTWPARRCPVAEERKRLEADVERLGREYAAIRDRLNSLAGLDERGPPPLSSQEC